MRRLRKSVLPALLLRRTKAGRAGDMALPCRLVRLRRDRLDATEDDFYTALFSQSQAQFDGYVERGTVLNNYAHIFSLLMRLRQAVDHPFLVSYSEQAVLQRAATAADAAAAASPAAASGGWSAGICAVCAEAPEDPVRAKCGHVFCRECARSLLDSADLDESDDDASMQLASDADADSDADESLDDEGAGPKRLKYASEPARPKAAVPQCPSCLAPLSIDLQAVSSADIAGDGSGVGTRSGGIMSRVPSAMVGQGFRSSTKIEALLEVSCRCTCVTTCFGSCPTNDRAGAAPRLD